MKYVISGRGFIGSELHRYLTLKLDYEVSFATLDLMRPYGLDILQIAKSIEFADTWDCFINASGPSNIEESITNPALYLRSPLEQVEKQIEILKLCGFKGVYVYVSSGAVYGNTPTTGAYENSELSPLSTYAQGKILVENFLEKQSLEESFPFEILVIRVFSAYSERLDTRVLAKIANAWMSNNSLRLAGSGNEIRDFIHTKDLTSIVDQILRSSMRPLFEIINIGTGIPIKIREIVELSRALMTVNSLLPSYVFDGTNRVSDPKIMLANIEKLSSYRVDVVTSPIEGLTTYFIGRKNG